MRLLFFGSPAFAVPTLRALHGAGHRIQTVVTRPDRPRGRSGRPAPTAVKQAAIELGLAVFQPVSANAANAVDTLRGADAELGVVVAYGEILKPSLLSVAERGFINLHASLLPKYRGAAPINWALMRGETATGVTVIRMSPELDAGPILAQRQVGIGPGETAGELADRLAALGAEAVLEVVDRLDAGEEIPGRPQPRHAGSLAPKLKKEDGKIDWSASAEQIRNKTRGLTPWPGAYSDFRVGDRLHRVTLLKVETDQTEQTDAPQAPGTVMRADEAEGIVVQAGAGAVSIKALKPAGRRAMQAADFIHGYRVKPGDRFL